MPPSPHTRVIVAQPKHLQVIQHLQRKFSNQLGFIPQAAVESYVHAKNVGIALENGEPVGYVLGRPQFRYQPLLRPITQAAVFMDAQRRHHGLALVNAICDRAIADGQQAVQASCAADIEATDFWIDAGFFPVHVHTLDNARKRKIIVFRRCLVQPAPAWFLTPPTHHGHRARKR